jgi:hypothetical protein
MKEGGIEPKSKAARLWRTVRTVGADRPRRPRGPSGLPSRTVRSNPADRPAVHRGPSVKAHRTPEATREKRTVRRGRADRPRHPRTVRYSSPDRPQTGCNKNQKPNRIENKGTQEHEEHAKNTVHADRPPGPRGPSAKHELN